ncbi:fimbrial protein [Budvicia diplopodorum]|uniref:fimbrial protein n=1 Tax=Budvicia diplopodorum TaxID=1119056 RepID=UPI00135AA22E|nr:fimbrial protein [Budvicia diplopodorum]
MKRNIISAALLASCMMSVAGNAAAVDGTVNFTGEIGDASCTVNIGSATGGNNATVNLGKVPVSSFRGVGSTAADAVGNTALKIILSDCPTGTPTTASLKFDGQYYEGDNNYLALNSASTATGVAIILSDTDSSHLPLGVRSKPVTLTVGTGTTNTLNYKAGYIQRKSTITAGSANSSATFTINY